MSEVKNIRMEDGRRAERHVSENGEERVIDLYVEEPRPLKLEKRVIEKTRPVVYERRISSFDPMSGQVTEEVVESTEPNVPMQLREHLGLVNPPMTNYATKDDLQNAIRIATETIVNANNSGNKVSMQSVFSPAPTMTAQEQIEERLGQKESFDFYKVVYGIIILGQLAFAGWIYFG